MSADQVAREFLPRFGACRTVEEGLATLTAAANALAASTAELVYLKLQTEPGWTPDAASALIDQCIEGHGLAITESVHAHGGTLDMVLQLTEASADAFMARLGELAGAQNVGGAA